MSIILVKSVLILGKNTQLTQGNGADTVLSSCLGLQLGVFVDEILVLLYQKSRINFVILHVLEFLLQILIARTDLAAGTL